MHLLELVLTSCLEMCQIHKTQGRVARLQVVNCDVDGVYPLVYHRVAVPKEDTNIAFTSCTEAHVSNLLAEHF